MTSAELQTVMVVCVLWTYFSVEAKHGASSQSPDPKDPNCWIQTGRETTETWGALCLCLLCLSVTVKVMIQNHICPWYVSVVTAQLPLQCCRGLDCSLNVPKTNDRTKSKEPLPAEMFVSIQTLKTSAKWLVELPNWGGSQNFRTFSTISHLAGVFVKTIRIAVTEKSHTKRHTHHWSNVSILSLLTRRAGQTLQTRQIIFKTNQEGMWGSTWDKTAR